MSETKKLVRLAVVARELNLGISTITDHLKKKGFDVDNKPTAKLTEEMHQVLLKDFQQEKAIKEKAEQISLGKSRENVELKEGEVKTAAQKKEEQEVVYVKNIGASTFEETKEEKTAPPEPAKKPAEPKPVPEDKKVEKAEAEKLEGPKVVGKLDLDKMNLKTRPEKKEKPAEKTEEPAPAAEPAAEEPQVVVEKTEVEKLDGPKVVGKIDLPASSESEKKKPIASSSGTETGKKKRRRKIRVKPGTEGGSEENKTDSRKKGKKTKEKEASEVSDKEIQERIKSTMSRLSSGSKTKGTKAKYKRLKKERAAEEQVETESGEKQVIQLTEFIAVSELANLIGVPYIEVIQTCMNLGIIVSINQRLDAEIIELVADEFGYDVEFINVDEQEDIEQEEEEEDDGNLRERAPIVTVMGHVDHGKTSLLDFIRSTNVIAGEAGGITQHIGAYEVTLDNGKKITFLDTPGHEAFTAMRARGAKLTDVAVIVIAADDNIMPQTKEAISHAQAAGVPMVFAINKIDKENANPEKIKEELANMNILVEDWGGKFQSQEISAKNGTNVNELLEKILLEAELLELKANPDKQATGTIIEATLEKGKGYVTTLLVQSGSLRVGDILVAGAFFGKIKALFNERGKKMESAGPSDPALILGLNGAPQAGEKFKIMSTDQEAKQLANRKEQIIREQGLRTKKHITLDEIGRRLALGNFKELNVIIKGDVDGSIEALSDSLQKLSTEEIQINIIHKAVGQIIESDVLLASASDAIIVGFQVRPSLNARKIAEKENIEIRLYSIIYDAIEEVKSAMEGLLEPKIEEEITGNIEIREVFKISKVGTIAGCYVLDGKVDRNTKVRVIREGIVVFTGELASLKRFKDDVKEVTAGLECGLGVKNFNDIKVGDIIEGYKEVEVKRKL